jgi:predicted PhzF superfamily epimerase YddE/YHI9
VVARAGDALSLSLPDWRATPRSLPELAAMMGGAVVETLWREGGYALFVYPDEAAVRALSPDFAAMKATGDTLFIATAPGETAEVVSRAFAPGAGIDEDPVTGSAHCVIARYWADRLGRDRFTAYQASVRGGHLEVRVGAGSVTLTGRCRTVVRGEFVL